MDFKSSDPDNDPSIPTISVQPSASSAAVMDDSASEHGSLADSSYDIISHSGTIDDDLGVTEGASTSSFPNSRAHTPAFESNIDEEEYQHLNLSNASASKHEQSHDLDDTPLASLRLPQPDVSSIHLAQSDSLLRLDHPFRISYQGVPADRDAVISKIAQALSLSCPAGDLEESEVRYSVSQLSSFGAEKEAPQVELVPHSGIEIVLECPAVSLTGQTLDGKLDTTKHSTRAPQQGKPDLLVIVHDSKSPAHLLANDPVYMPGVPRLHLCESITGYPAIPLHETDLHLQINGKTTPSDVQHFLELDAAALNRHLAYLVPIGRATQVRDQVKSFLATMADLSQRIRRVAINQGASRQAVTALIVASVLASAVCASLLFTRQFQSPANPVGLPSMLAIPEMTLKASAGEKDGIDPQAPAATPQSEWFVMRAPSMSTLSQSAVVTLDAENSQAQDDPPVELVHVKDWLYYLKMPNHLAKSRRLPQLTVTATSDNKPVDSSLAKWNATVYSLELQPSPGTGAVDVFVRFAKGERTYTYKIEPASSWLGLKPLNGWVDQKSIESGIAAYMATTKELSRMASKEVSLFRDQANGLVISSVDWLQSSMGNVRNVSQTNAVDLWRNFELQTVAVTKALQVYNKDLGKSLSKNIASISETLSKQATGIAASRNRLQRDLKHTQKTVEKQIGMLQRRLTGLRLPHNRGLKMIGAAQARAKAIAEGLQDRFQQRHLSADPPNGRRKPKKGKSCKRSEKGR